MDSIIHLCDLNNQVMFHCSDVPGSKLPILGMVIPPLIGNPNPYNGYINPYYWVDDHPLLHGNNWTLDPSTDEFLKPIMYIRVLGNSFLFQPESFTIGSMYGIFT